MSERVWTETKLKAEEMLRAVDIAFARLGAAVNIQDKESIERAATKVRTALETNDVRKLKEANTELDEATQGLAAVVIEHALQSAK